jgi:hypothetical protein
MISDPSIALEALTSFLARASMHRNHYCLSPQKSGYERRIFRNPKDLFCRCLDSSLIGFFLRTFLIKTETAFAKTSVSFTGCSP